MGTKQALSRPCGMCDLKKKLDVSTGNMCFLEYTLDCFCFLLCFFRLACVVGY